MGRGRRGFNPEEAVAASSEAAKPETIRDRGF